MKIVSDRDDEKSREQSTKAVRQLETVDEVVSLFTEADCFRERLEFVAEYLMGVSEAWSRSGHPDLDVTLGVLRELAEDAAVPPGCEHAQEVLMWAIDYYLEAADRIQRARPEVGPEDYEVAWGRAREGRRFLSEAMERTHKD